MLRGKPGKERIKDLFLITEPRVDRDREIWDRFPKWAGNVTVL